MKKQQFYNGAQCQHCKVGALMYFMNGSFICPLCPYWDTRGKVKVKKLTEDELLALYNQVK